MYLLVVYDRRKEALRESRRFEDGERDLALAARLEAELKQRQDQDVEVVLLWSDSEETLRRTHARFFKTVGEIAGPNDP